MRSVVIFSCSLLLGIWTHSILVGLLLVLITALVLFVVTHRAQVSALQGRTLFVLTLLPRISIAVYDILHAQDLSNLASPLLLTIHEQEKAQRYRAVSADGHQIMLFSDQALRPGMRSESFAQPRRLDYDTTRCWLTCPGFASFSAWWSTPSSNFNYDAWLYMQGIDARVTDSQLQLLDIRPLSRVQRTRGWIKDRLKSSLSSPRAQALGLGMLLGDRAEFSESDYQDFIHSGLVHIIAVSGTHLAIMMALASILLWWLPFRPRMIVLMIVVIGYAYLVGIHASIVRATLMSLLTLFALLAGRPVSILRLMAYAWIVILLINPYMLLYDLGFGLSFGALAGIVYVKELLQHTALMTSHHSFVKTLLYRLVTIILMSCGATIGILPLLALTTGQVNILSPVFNALVIPLVPLIMALLILLLLWGGLFSRIPGLSSTFDILLSQLLEFVTSVAHYGAQDAFVIELSTRAGLIFLLALTSYRRRRSHTHYGKVQNAEILSKN